jgi:hypothetical protein
MQLHVSATYVVVVRLNTKSVIRGIFTAAATGWKSHLYNSIVIKHIYVYIHKLNVYTPSGIERCKVLNYFIGPVKAAEQTFVLILFLNLKCTFCEGLVLHKIATLTNLASIT